MKHKINELRKAKQTKEYWILIKLSLNDTIAKYVCPANLMNPHEIQILKLQSKSSSPEIFSIICKSPE